jgi:tetraacyldisaccharide-1-P 4'-kinase
VKYDKTTLPALAAAMGASGADCAVTTEKDGVKLKQLPPELARLTLVAPLELTFEDPSPLTASLHNLLQK